MGVSVTEQLRQMTAGVIAGGGLGLLWSLLRWLVPENKTWAFTAVGLFWIALTGVTVLVLSLRLGAGLRLFFLCSCALGIALYFWGLEERVRTVPVTFRVFIRELFKNKKKHRKEP